MAEKRRKLTAESPAVGETEDRQQQAQWKELSSDILERIYYFLSYKDKVNMSLVCRGWSKGFGMPSLWRKFDFDLNFNELRERVQETPCIKFAEKYSKFFRHVRIYCSLAYEGDLFNAWIRHFEYFVEILIRNSQLESVVLFNFRSCWDKIGSREIYEAIVEFLKSQPDLKEVHFQYCQFPYNEGTRILKILADKSGQSLKCLIFDEFFDSDIDEEQILNALEEFPRILAFTKLETVRTDYSSILEYLLACRSKEIQKLKKNETHALSKIALFYRPPIDYTLSEGLTSDHWQILTRMFPDLKVEMLIEGHQNLSRDLRFLIMRNMPIVLLNFSHYDSSCTLQIQTLFNHLRACQVNEYLDTFVFQCVCRLSGNFNSFISFVSDCTKLRRLVLYITKTSNAIKFIESLRSNTNGSLKDVHIVNLELIDNRDYPNLMRTVDKISPDLGFNLTLSDVNLVLDFVP